MRYFITINQLSIIKRGLDLDIYEAIILEHLYFFANSGKASKIVENETVYYWFNYDKIAADLPILGLKRDAVYKRLKQLCAKGFLKANPLNQSIGKPYYAINQSVNVLFFETAENPRATDGDPDSLRTSVRSATDERPDNSIINYSNIKDSNNGDSDKSETPAIKTVEKNLFFTGAMDVYYRWFTDLNDEPPKIDAADGKALKTIIAYLKKSAKNKEPEISEEKLLSGVLSGFKFLLDNWNRLDPFLRKQVKLTQINSNLTNIINELKNGKSKIAGGAKGFATNR